MSRGSQRSVELGLLALLVGLVALLIATEVGAAPRPKLSKDLAEAVEAGQGRDVIFQADRATVEAVTRRHGPVLVKWLKTGAVLRASADRCAPWRRIRPSGTSPATRSCGR